MNPRFDVLIYETSLSLFALNTIINNFFINCLARSIIEIWNSTSIHGIVQTQKKLNFIFFLNVPQLERQRTDLQTKNEELQIINQSLRENDKVKEDALAHLSD